MPETGTRLRTERLGRVLVVTFTNPPRNFFDEATSIELYSLVRKVKRDSSVGAVVLTGDDGFVTHMDVGDLLRGGHDTPFFVPYRLARISEPMGRVLVRSGPLERMLRRTRFGSAIAVARGYRTLRLMNSSDKVFIAAINGVALGMGAILALACDLRIMADEDDAAFGVIETGISILGAGGGTQRLTRMVGQARSLELLLEGRMLAPAEAAAIGLIHRVAPPQALHEEALALAHRVAARAPVVNREIKRMVYDAGSRPFRRATRMESASFITTISHPRAVQDMETYLTAISRYPQPTNQQVIDAWHAMLGTAPVLSLNGNTGAPRRTSTTRRQED